MGVNRKILSMFYQSTVESVMFFWISRWHGNSELCDRKKLKKVIKSAKKPSCNVTDLDKLYKVTLTKKREKIMNGSQPSSIQILFKYAQIRKQQMLDSKFAQTKRFKNSFILSAIRELNKYALWISILMWIIIMPYQHWMT